jgi:hypothetical protein
VLSEVKVPGVTLFSRARGAGLLRCAFAITHPTRRRSTLIRTRQHTGPTSLFIRVLLVKHALPYKVLDPACAVSAQRYAVRRTSRRSKKTRYAMSCGRTRTRRSCPRLGANSRRRRREVSSRRMRWMSRSTSVYYWLAWHLRCFCVRLCVNGGI